MHTLGETGTVYSVNISEKKGTRKTPVDSGVITLETDHGVKGDAHGGRWHRQVSFLATASIETARTTGLDVKQGDFGENITTDGLEMKTLPLGTRLSIGPTEIEISQIGKVCHRKCAIYYLAGDCIFPREGVFGWVVKGGDIHVGDEIRIIALGDGTVHHIVSEDPEAADVKNAAHTMTKPTAVTQ